MGDTREALTWLERAYEERSSWLVWIKVEPRFDRLRSEPRFVSLLRRMRLQGEEPTEPARVSAERRLVAIMFTDMVGFTKLAQRDEAAALQLLEEHRAILRPIFASRGGREVKTMGDGFMVEFPSAIESVRCAMEIQAAMTKWNRPRTPRTRARIRIGIHVGDVVREGNDLVGDGVNIASRIEPLADAGGICITGSVLDQYATRSTSASRRFGSLRSRMSRPRWTFTECSERAHDVSQLTCHRLNSAAGHPEPSRR